MKRLEPEKAEVLPPLPPVDPEPLPLPEVLEEPDVIIYTVQKGDSISLIAQRHNTSVSEIVALNKLDDPDKIRVGQTLLLPGYVDTVKPVPTPAPKVTVADDANVYVVRENDTLSGIAAQLNVSANELMRLNKLSDPDKIVAGQELVIPDSATLEPDDSDMIPVPSVKPDERETPVVPETDDDTIIHTVEAGQTLRSIAMLYVVSVKELAEANELPVGAALEAGRRLIIPAP